LTRRTLHLCPIADQAQPRYPPGILTGSIRRLKRDSEGVPHIASGPLPDSEGGTACHTW
jgi:hypothetical protein